ncbi:MAG: hypothetical protein JXB32_04625 [Deltaproteobacteria bacterium]|nr:hypothetical protein [Deltaproteobacteria bacterium]
MDSDSTRLPPTGTVPVALILDPRLPGKTRTYLRDREPQADGRYRLVEPPPSDPQRDGLRDAALEAATTGPALVVLAEHSDREFLEAAGVRITWARPTRRGWTLIEAPDLLPLPPPRLWDEHGKPLMPIVGPSGSEEDIDSIPLAKALAKWFGTPAPDGPPDGDEVALVDKPRLSAEALDGRLGRTELWVQDGKLWAWGPRLDELREKLSPWHVVEEPGDWYEAWQKVVGGNPNPWPLEEALHQPDAPALAELRARFGRVADTWVASWVQQQIARLLDAARVEPPPTSVRPDAPAETSAREELQRLADRGAQGTPEALALHFLLAAMLEAPLRVAPPAEGERLHLWASLGPGHLVELRVLALLGESHPLRALRRDTRTGPELAEAGDALLVFRTHTSSG